MTISSIAITHEAADAIATIISAKALGHFKANTVLARLVARDWENEISQKGQTVTVFKRGALSVNDKSEHTIITLQAPAPSHAHITLDQHREVSFLVDDPAAALATPDLLDGYMEDAIKVLAEDVDDKIAALYSGLSQTIDASGANGPLTAEDFIEARRLLNAAKAPLAGRFAVLHEDADAEFHNLDEANSRDYSTRRDGMPNAQALAYASYFKGFDVYLDQKINVATAVCKNIFAHKYALALATRPLPPAPDGLGVFQKVMDEDGVGLRVTLSYNADYLGLQVTVDVLYGVAEIIDAFGVVVSTSEV